MLTILPSISSSYWSLVVCYINMISEITLKKLDFVIIAKSVLKNIQVISPIIITHGVLKNNKDSNIKHYQWELRKNLETLSFLEELESRYDINKSLPKFIEECNSIKTGVQQRTIQLTKKLTSYKG